MCASPRFRRPSGWRTALRRAWIGVALAPALVALAASATSAPAEQKIPFRQSEDSAADLLLRVAGGLIVVLLVGAGGVYALKRYLPSFYHPTFAGSARIKLVELRRLTPKTTLFLVELDGVQLLLGQSSDRVTMLYEYPKDFRKSDTGTK